MFYSLLILFGLILVICVSTRYSRRGRLLMKIPGPKSIPLVGNFYQVVLLDAEQLWNYLRKRMHTYYPIGCLWFFTHTIILTRDPNDVKIILSCKRNITKPSMYEYFAVTGILCTTGEKWRKHRQIINPAFYTNILNAHVEIINECTEKTISYIESLGNETIQSVEPLTEKLILHIVCESIMNVDLNTVGTELEKQYRESVNRLMRIVRYRTFKPFLTDTLLKFSRLKKKQEQCLRTIRDFTKKVIQEKREYFEQNIYESFQTVVNDVDMMEIIKAKKAKQKRFMFLDQLLSAQKNGIIDEQDVIEEVATIIVAGYETTTVAINCILMLLAENQTEQDLARAEALKVLDESGGKITFREIHKMDFIARCIKESLRLLPPAPHILRYVTNEIQLKNYTIPVGTELGISIFDLHRDPKYWPNPEKFDPDRFLPENIKTRHPFTYIPFSAGLRNCIGKKFSIMLLTIIVARVLCNFYLEPVVKMADLRFQADVTIKTAEPIKVKFIQLNKK